MSNQLRNGIEKKKAFYLKQLIAAGFLKVSDTQSHTFTLSELEHIFNTLAKPKS